MSEWDEVDEFDLAVPGLPANRVQKLREVFMKSMGEPSMLHLVPVLRENMPDDLNHKWLKRKNMENAEFVMAKARENGSVDMHTLNNMLQVECSFGSLNRALAFYHDEFKSNGIVSVSSILFSFRNIILCYMIYFQLYSDIMYIFLVCG
jgi:hypothetical protein